MQVHHPHSLTRSPGNDQRSNLPRLHHLQRVPRKRLRPQSSPGAAFIISPAVCASAPGPSRSSSRRRSPSEIIPSSRAALVHHRRHPQLLVRHLVDHIHHRRLRRNARQSPRPHASPRSPEPAAAPAAPRMQLRKVLRANPRARLTSSASASPSASITVVEAVGARFIAQASAVTPHRAKPRCPRQRRSLAPRTDSPSAAQPPQRRQQRQQLLGLPAGRERNHHIARRHHPQVAMQRLRRMQKVRRRPSRAERSRNLPRNQPALPHPQHASRGCRAAAAATTSSTARANGASHRPIQPHRQLQQRARLVRTISRRPRPLFFHFVVHSTIEPFRMLAEPALRTTTPSSPIAVNCSKAQQAALAGRSVDPRHAKSAPVLAMFAGLALVVWSGVAQPARPPRRHAAGRAPATLILSPTGAAPNAMLRCRLARAHRRCSTSPPRLHARRLDGKKVSLSDFKGKPAGGQLLGHLVRPLQGRDAVVRGVQQEIRRRRASRSSASPTTPRRARTSSQSGEEARRHLSHPARRQTRSKRHTATTRSPAHVLLRRQDRQGHRGHRRPRHQRTSWKRRSRRPSPQEVATVNATVIASCPLARSLRCALRRRRADGR